LVEGGSLSGVVGVIPITVYLGKQEKKVCRRDGSEEDRKKEHMKSE